MFLQKQRRGKALYRKKETFVKCKIVANERNEMDCICQPKLIKYLKEEFGALIESIE
jgi:hypothetical protein